jgi:D-glycero-alpha-D-manno-heptose-7-phosphate kinase
MPDARRRIRGPNQSGLVVTQTPLRVSFAGGGTDLPAFYEADHGAVFSTTIDKYVYVTVKRHGPVFDEKIRLNYSVSEAVGHIDAIRNDIARECLRLLEIDPPIYISVVSDLPDSSGLGGSSSFAVGLLNALHTFRGERVTAAQLADEASRIEIDVLGQPIGKQDQYAAAIGGLNLLTFRPAGNVTVEPVTGGIDAVHGLFDRLLMLWTGHQRKSSSVLYEQRSRTSEHGEHLNRMRDQAYELQSLMRQSEPDYDQFGRMLDAGWRMKRELASTVSNDVIDEWYGRGIDAGAIGGKLCGAGGGGFLLFLAEPEHHPDILEALGDLTSVPIGYEAHGSRVLLAQLD